MHVRLAFAVAIQVDADILLIDEVLAVGDAAFQQKCFDEFARLKREGRTIVFVTHDMGAVERFCDRAMLLERGRVVEIGEPADVAREYNELNFQRVREEAREAGTGPDVLPADAVAEVVRASFESPAGSDRDHRAGRTGAACGWMSASTQTMREPDLRHLAAQRGRSDGVRHQHAARDRSTPGGSRPGDVATVRIPFENWLAPGPLPPDRQRRA